MQQCHFGQGTYLKGKGETAASRGQLDSIGLSGTIHASCPSGFVCQLRKHRCCVHRHREKKRRQDRRVDPEGFRRASDDPCMTFDAHSTFRPPYHHHGITTSDDATEANCRRRCGRGVGGDDTSSRGLREMRLLGRWGALQVLPAPTRIQYRRLPTRPPVQQQVRRGSSIAAEDIAGHISNPESKYQIFVSRTKDPFANLAIENYLLKHSPKESTILFLYVNAPCVVIGRNQNPWLEVNLGTLASTQAQKRTAEPRTGVPIQLVRRRSGGGTVFHDEGNVNYCVICPTANFTRDKHAEMMTRAIRTLTPRVRVNERHDIVMDQGEEMEAEKQPEKDDMHRTAFYTENVETPPLKVSGSAYKLTKGRALHHGTCLVSSPNLEIISGLLRSPARGFFQAKGVESVRSPIANIMQTGHRFSFLQRQIIQEFANLYKITGVAISPERSLLDMPFQFQDQCLIGTIRRNMNILPGLWEDMQELMSEEWLYGQTPAFVFSRHLDDSKSVQANPFQITSKDKHTSDRKQRRRLKNVSLYNVKPSKRDLLTYTLTKGHVRLEVQSGTIKSADISVSPFAGSEQAEIENLMFRLSLEGKPIHRIQNFVTLLEQNVTKSYGDPRGIVRRNWEGHWFPRWLNGVFGKGGSQEPQRSAIRKSSTRGKSPVREKLLRRRRLPIRGRLSTRERLPIRRLSGLRIRRLSRLPIRRRLSTVPI